ncbi:hypothetical protein B0H12DRAFT_1224549, partial [Mycena haematopus]
MSDERAYVDLIYRATQKYGSWDPETAVNVGDGHEGRTRISSSIQASLAFQSGNTYPPELGESDQSCVVAVPGRRR